MTELPSELPAELATELVRYRLRLITGDVIAVQEVAGWDEFIAARAADDPRSWVRLPSGSLLAPSAVVLIERL